MSGSESEERFASGLELELEREAPAPGPRRPSGSRSVREVANVMVAQRTTTRFAAQWLRLLQSEEFRPKDIECMTLAQLYKKAGLCEPTLFPSQAYLTKGELNLCKML